MKTTSAKIKSPKKGDVKKNSFHVVAIGASAGGLEAMMELLKYLPADTGMAFIYVQHLSPDHKSMLTEILSKKTSMVVQEIDDMDKIKPNNIFVIPYNQGIEVTDGHIKLIPRSETSAAISIDILFSSLAEAQKERVIGITLSGSASDGTQGMKAIKQNGGLTFAQDDTAKFTSMPHSAIAAGVVDFILSPKEIALELSRLSKNPFIKTTGIKNGEEDLIENSSPDLKSILSQLHKATGVDFSLYKMNTIKRRIIRRMFLYKISQLKEYAKLLSQKKEEIDILYQDLLINVTSFFRDTDTHKYLKDHLFPKLLSGKKPGESLRIWVPACATGEEAYSIAMMLLEIQENKTMNIPVQIFATDLSEQAISRARIGNYTKQEMETVSPKRLQRFFNKTNEGFQVNKAVRDTCVFATHNILQDPPFSRLDFISCCNLFIYFDNAAQKKAINTFHYALKDGGFLMLGKSENITQSANLFKSFIEKYKIFLRKNSSTRSLPQLSQRFVQQTLAENNIPATYKNQVKQTPIANRVVTHNGLDNAIDAVLITEFMPASVVINLQLEIIQFRGTTDLFLTHPKGKATFNILKMARPEIAFELRNGISKVIKTKQRFRKSGIELRINSALKIISLEIVPLKIQSDEDLLLILFTEQEQAEMYVSHAPGGKSNSLAKDRRIKKLEEELALAYADAIALAQEHEAFTEELQSASEEVVSSNEELQTLNEELETSKEEIESANEELTTTNQELQTRNDLLNESYDYSEALLSTLHEPMIVLDKNLRVKSANNTFYKKFKVKEEETEGELLYDLGNKQWNIPRLKELLENILPRNTHFQDFEISHNFPFIGEKIMLLNASRIIQKANHEELILLAIADVTQVRKLALANLNAEKKILHEKIVSDQKIKKLIEEKKEQLQDIFRNAPAATAVLEGPEHNYILANDAYQKLFYRQAKDFLGKSIAEVFPELKGSGTFELVNRVFKTGESYATPEYPLLIDDKNTGVLRQNIYNFSLKPIKNDLGEIYAVIAMIYDVTQQVEARKKIEESDKQKRYQLKLNAALSPLANPLDIEKTVTEIALDFMEADWCHYSTIENDNLIINRDAVRGNLPSLVGVYPINSFSLFKSVLHLGRPLIVDDVHTTDKLDEDLKQRCIQLQNISFIFVPVIKNGKPVGLLSLVQSKPRKWTDVEVQLNIDTAERTWAAVERAKAEEALGKSEEKYRTLFTSIDQGFTLCELIRNPEGKAIDMYIREVNPTYEKQTGVAKEMVVDKPLLQIFPSLHTWLVKYAAVVDNQRPIVFENYFEEMNRWFAIKAYPIENDRFAVLFSDITEQKQASQYARSLIEASLDPLVTISADGKITDVNEASIKVTGIEREKLIDTDFSNYFTEPEKAQEGYQQAFEKGFVADYPLTIKHTNGNLTDVLYNASIYKNDKGNVIGVFAAARDITERKKAEEKIIKSEHKIREINEQLELSIQAGKIGTWNWDVKKDILSWSKEQNEIYGISAPESITSSAQFNALIVPEDLKRIQNDQGASNKIEHEYDFRIVRKNDGEIRWVKSRAKNKVDSKGALQSISGVNIDVTEQIQALHKLEESENRFRNLADASPMLIWTLDANGLSSYYNKTFLDFLGVSKDEDIADWKKIVHPDDFQNTYDIINEAIAKQTSYSLDCRLLGADGSWCWMMSKGNMRMGNNNEFLGFIGSSFDITERKNYENVLKEAKTTAENTVKFKQQFLSNMSHEIRTPLNSIIGFTNVLLKTDLDSKQMEFVEAIKTSGKSLNLLINDILDLAKVDAGKMTFENQAFEIRKSITEILHSFDLAIKEKNLKLVEEFDNKIPDVLMGDSVRLNQIIINLIGNAVKFTQKGKITLSVKLINENPENVNLEFTVSDTGIGIAENKKVSIFNLFEQAEISTANSHGGTGLGLAIVKQFIDAQGGIISVRSKLGEGSSFCFILPFGKSNVTSQQELEIPKLDMENNKVRVLVAEDVALNQLLIKIILSDFGFEFEIVSNGKLAIEKLQINTYDIVLMDLQMPEMNGFEATEFIRNTLKSEIPIIALTADVTTMDVTKCKEFGMDDYISKPISENLLYSKIVELVVRKK